MTIPKPSTDLVLASRWANAANRRREGLRAAHTQDEAVLTDLLHTYLRLKSPKGGRISALTLEHYAESLRRFLAFTGPSESPAHSLTQLEPETFELWLLHLQAQGLSASSVRRHLYGVRNLMKALVWAGVLKSDPSASVRPPADAQAAHTRKQALGLEKYQELLSLTDTQEPTTAARDRLLLLLGGSLGLRAAEIVGLNVDDIAGGRMVVRGKGSKERLLPVPQQVDEALQTWLRLRGVLVVSTDALLVSLSHRNVGGRLTTKGARTIAEKYYRAAGLPPEQWGLHTLRRTAGTHLYRATRDLHVVADVLGHSSVTTSAIYAKMDSDIRREALEKLAALQQQGKAPE